MRGYARSVALYERTRKHLAGGVSSNIRYASTPVPLFFERGEGLWAIPLLFWAMCLGLVVQMQMSPRLA